MNYTADQISRVLRTRPLYYGPTKIKVDKVSGESVLLSDSASILISTITELFQIANDDWEVLGEISTEGPPQ